MFKLYAITSQIAFDYKRMSYMLVSANTTHIMLAQREHILEGLQVLFPAWLKIKQASDWVSVGGRLRPARALPGSP